MTWVQDLLLGFTEFLRFMWAHSSNPSRCSWIISLLSTELATTQLGVTGGLAEGALNISHWVSQVKIVNSAGPSMDD